MTVTAEPEVEAPTVESTEVPWNGVLAPEGVLSGDGRRFNVGSLTWRDLPLPLSWQKATAMGHDGSVVVGRIETIVRDAEDRLVATGFFDDSEEARYVIRQIANKSVRGVSVDVDQMTAVFEDSEGNPVAGDDFFEVPDVMAVESGRVAGATICAIPAFMEAYVAIPDDFDLTDVLAKEKNESPFPAPEEKAPADGEDEKATLDAKSEALLAQDPPPDDFDEQVADLLEEYVEASIEPPDDLMAAAGFTAQVLPDHLDATLDAFESIDEGEWKGGAQNYTPEQWIKATLIHLEPGPDQTTNTKGLHKLPVRTPSGTLSRRAIYSAASILAGARGGVKAPSADKADAAREVVRLYRNELGEEPPKSVLRLAGERTESLVAGGGNAFANPEFTDLTPLTLDGDRIYGHLAAWGTCHIGFGNTCVQPPHSVSNYAYFGTGLRGGAPVGAITMGTGHAQETLGAAPALAHYDNTGHAVADITVGEDAFGIWYSGLVRPGLSEDDREALAASALSGDWRKVRGNLELVAALAVNVPGFPIPRLAVASYNGEQTALVASGVVVAETEPLSPDLVARVMKALDRRERARAAAIRIGRDKRSRAAAAAARMGRS